MRLIDALQPDSPYVFYSDDHGFCINTADVMDILTMDKESGYHWIPCSGDMQKDDVIYRQAAIDAAKELCLHYTPTKSVKHPHIDFVVEELERLPSAHQRWIPCSERLPEANGRYLVTRGLNACGALWNRVYIINYTDLMGLKSGRIWWDGNVGKSDFEQIADVIAWMPLPKPYGGESK